MEFLKQLILKKAIKPIWPAMGSTHPPSHHLPTVWWSKVIPEVGNKVSCVI